MLDSLATGARVAMLGLILLAWAGGWLSLAITVALLAAAVPLYRRAGNRSEKMALEVQSRRAVLEARQLELLHHAPELRALGAVQYGASEIAAISDAEHTVAMRAIRIALESSLITEFLSGVSIGLVAMVVGFSLLGGRTSLAHGLVAVLVTSEIFLNVRRYGVEFHRRENALLAEQTLRDATDLITNEPTGVTLEANSLVTAASSIPVTIQLADGARLLVSGPSGSGKTTLLHTFVGWRAPVSGVVHRTSSPVGYVSVESPLIEGSLRDNLTVGADIADSVLARQLAELGLTGSRFDDLDTMVLADSRGISTGERVRLILARALLTRPPLIVIDDIAGVLDVDSRALVRATLERNATLSIVEATGRHFRSSRASPSGSRSDDERHSSPANLARSGATSSRGARARDHRRSYRLGAQRRSLGGRRGATRGERDEAWTQRGTRRTHHHRVVRLSSFTAAIR